MRGISPVIATVIILAVTVAIAVAVIGWITGLFSSATGGTEELQIMPDSYINASGTQAVLILHVVNKGSDVTIYKIEAAGIGATATTITVPAGADTTYTVTLPGSAVAGTTYTIKVYTKNGNVFTATVIAKK